MSTSTPPVYYLGNTRVDTRDYPTAAAALTSVPAATVPVDQLGTLEVYNLLSDHMLLCTKAYRKLLTLFVSQEVKDYDLTMLTIKQHGGEGVALEWKANASGTGTIEFRVLCTGFIARWEERTRENFDLTVSRMMNSRFRPAIGATTGSRILGMHRRTCLHLDSIARPQLDTAYIDDIKNSAATFGQFEEPELTAAAYRESEVLMGWADQLVNL